MKYVVILVLLGLSAWIIVKQIKSIVMAVKEKKSQNNEKGDSE